MNDHMSNLKSIAMEYLFDGMTVTEDIYNYDGNLLLLSKGSVLTENKIRQLREFNARNCNVFVSESTYNALLQRGISNNSSMSQKYLDEKLNYTKLKNATADLLDDVRKTGIMSKNDTDGIAAEMLEKLDTIDPALIFQCINTPNPMDEYLRSHSVNVGLLNGLIGKWLSLPQNSVDDLVLAGLVHDIGKTKIPLSILNAPRKLTAAEFEVIKIHPAYSYDLLDTDWRFTEPIKSTALQHHEKMNGQGYPDQLTADKISLFAKITAISDIYDAMISKRVYKDAANPFSIISQMSTYKFSGLDTNLVNLFTEHMPSALIGKPALLSDGSIGIIRFLLPGNLEYPLVEVNNQIKKTDCHLYCLRVIF